LKKKKESRDIGTTNDDRFSTSVFSKVCYCTPKGKKK
jgi:hypothetical protein